MTSYLRVAVAGMLFWLALPATAQTAPCAPGLVLSGPYCITEAENAAWIAHLASTTSTTTQPPPVVSSPQSVSGVERWTPMVAYYWGKHGSWVVDRMLRIAKCESNGDPEAVNPRSGAIGIFQIMPFWQKTWPGDYTDAWTNAAVAYQIWLSQGYRAWVCK